MAWYNADGLKVRFHGQENTTYQGLQAPERRVLRAYYDPVAGNGLKFTTDRDNDGTADGFSGEDAFLPAGAYIEAARLFVTEAFTAAGAATLTIGLAEEDGTAIDADGIDVAIAKTAIDAIGDVVRCDGALVGGARYVGADNAFLYATVGTGPYTAGKAWLEVEYVVYS